MLLAGCTKRYADRRGATTGCKISYPLIPSHNYRAAHRCLPYDTIAYAGSPQSRAIRLMAAFYGSNCRLYQPQSRAILYVGGRCRRMLLAGCTKRYADRRGATTGCKISYPLIPSHNYRAAHRCLPYDTIAYAMLPPRRAKVIPEIIITTGGDRSSGGEL